MTEDDASALSGFIVAHDPRFPYAHVLPLFQAAGQSGAFIVEAADRYGTFQHFTTIPLYVRDALSQKTDLAFVLALKHWLQQIKQIKQNPLSRRPRTAV